MSNRNFDSRTIIHRLQEQNTAQGLFKAQQAGKQLISNPQTSDPSPQRVLSYKEGVQTTYYKNLKGGYTTSNSGITNLVTK
jgi:hypothetical protein